jgi:hypothetical protein
MRNIVSQKGDEVFRGNSLPHFKVFNLNFWCIGYALLFKDDERRCFVRQKSFVLLIEHPCATQKRQHPYRPSRIEYLL